jgi:hypothetical protein
MTIKEFFSIPSVRFGTHVFLVLGVMINVYQFYRIDKIQKDLDKESSVLGLLTQENSDAKNEKDYYGSKLFKETYAKEYDNFKIRGETVVDTSLVEPDSSKKNNDYKPAEVVKPKANWEKWWETFFLPGLQKTTK